MGLRYRRRLSQIKTEGLQHIQKEVLVIRNQPYSLDQQLQRRRTNEALDEHECPAIISISYNAVWILLIAGKASMLIHNSPP